MGIALPGGVGVSLRARLGNWIAGNVKRAGVPPIPIVPELSFAGGVGSIHHAPHDVLLREAIGVADTCTRKIADRIAGLTFEVFVERRITDGTTEDEILDDHPLAALLRNPHPNFTASQLKRLTAQWITTVGEAYWLKVGNGYGVPGELHPMPPGRVEPVVQRNVIAGYVVTDANGRRHSVAANEMIRFWFPDPENPWRSEGYFGPNGIVADSRRFASEHLRAHYQQNATPPLALVAKQGAPDEPNEAQRAAFREAWNQHFSRRFGSAGGAPAIIPAFYEIVQIALQTGAEITPLLEHWRDEMFIAYGVPKSVCGLVVSGDRSSAETNQWVFDRYTNLPLSILIAESLESQLAPDFDERIGVRFARFVDADKDYELRREAHDLEHAVRTIDQVRKDRGEDPVPWGSTPTIASKITPYDPDAKPAPPVGDGTTPPDGDEPEAEDEPDPSA